jgi:transcriptional regulator with XRE-family HTH domain
MTQADVADLTGIARSAFSMIESGQRNPSVKVAQRIGKVLKIRWTVFFTQDNTNSVVGNAS